MANLVVIQPAFSLMVFYLMFSLMFFLLLFLFYLVFSLFCLIFSLKLSLTFSRVISATSRDAVSADDSPGSQGAPRQQL